MPSLFLTIYPMNIYGLGFIYMAVDLKFTINQILKYIFYFYKNINYNNLQYNIC